MTQDAKNFLNQEGEKIVHVIGLDFAQYFDKVQSKKLLHKIAELEVTDKILFQWCAKLLRRKVQVKVGNKYSEEARVYNSIPQGASSSVMLATIYSARLSEINSANCSIICYVDDTTIITVQDNTEQGLQKVQEILDTIYQITIELGLELNPIKFQYMKIHDKKVKPVKGDLRSPGGQIIKCSPKIKVLGYIWTNDFSNDSFIDQTINKSRRLFWFLARQLRTKKVETWLKAYKIYIRSILEYLSPILSDITRKQKEKLESIQKSILSYIYRR